MNPEHISIPERPNLIVNEGKDITRRFIDLLKRWRAEISAVFNAETNEHASWPDEDWKRLFRDYKNRPKLAIELAVELSTMIMEIEQEDRKLLGKEAYAHQLGQLKWLVMSLLEGGTSYTIEGAPGTGKTLVLGAIMRAATRLQLRGLMDGAVVYGTHRPYILSQQTFSADERRLRLMNAPDTRDVKQEIEYCEKILGAKDAKCINLLAWRELRLKKYKNRYHAVAKICELISNRIARAKFRSKHSDALMEIARLLTGEGVLVFDIDETSMMVPLSPAPVTDDETSVQYSGDIGRGIPPEYAERGFVTARRGADVEGNRLDSRAGKKTLETARVLLTTASSVVMKGSRRAIKQVLERTGIVIVDEGRDAATAFQDAVVEVSEGATPPPLVFIASALSTTNGLGSRPYADRYSPRLTIEDAMEPGPDGKQVLPNVGVDMFPGKNAVLYPDTTVEALQQFIVAHFSELPLPEATDLPQPYMCTSLILVAPECIQEAVRMLRIEYAKRDIPADVIPFRKNSERSKSSGNTTVPESERVLQAMMDDYEGPKGKHVRILVSSSDNVKDALSIGNLQNVTVATGYGIGANALLRIVGRLQHSNLHRKAGPAYRGYFRQGLYKNTKPAETIFHLLGKTEGDSLEWVPLQILKGRSGAAADLERVAGLPTISIPLSNAELRKRNQEKGTSVRQVALNRQHVELLPSVSSAKMAEEIELSPMWTGLSGVANRAMPEWSDPATWAAYTDILLEFAYKIAPPFMKEDGVWQAWEAKLRVEMSDQRGQGSHRVLEALKNCLVKGVRFGKFEDGCTVELIICDEDATKDDDEEEVPDDAVIETAEEDEEETDQPDIAELIEPDDIEPDPDDEDDCELDDEPEFDFAEADDFNDDY